jgi:DnaJ-class molecular chaperone
MFKNYYIILGIDFDAEPAQIKSAYRRKAQELHPDHSGEDSLPFLQVQEAYRVLSDPRQKKAYDRRLLQIKKRETGLEDSAGGRGKRSAAQPEPLIPKNRSMPIEPLEPISLSHSFANYFPSMEGIAVRLFRNIRNPDQLKSEQSERLSVEIKLSRRQVSTGGQVRIMIQVNLYCPLCRGAGSLGFWQCLECLGSGVIRQELPLIVTYPSEIEERYEKNISLSRFGIDNYFLRVIFRVTDEAD